MWAMTKADHDELTAYRATGMSPEQVAQMAQYMNDPAPLPLEQDGCQIVNEDCGGGRDV